MTDTLFFYSSFQFKCGGTSFYSSVDMQLFILGLIVIYIFAKNETAGYITCASLVICSYVHIAYNVIVHETTGLLFKSNPVPIKISEYFDYVHMVTSSYVPG